MKVKQKSLTFLVITAVAGLTGIAGWFLYVQKQNSSKDYSELLGCRRVTADYRNSDYFCGHMDQFNNPTIMSDDEIYNYYSCKDYLKTDHEYNSKIGCGNPEKLRQTIYSEVKRLKRG